MIDPLAELRQVVSAEPPPGAGPVATVIVVDAEAALPALLSYFASGDDRRACRLIVSGADLGYVGRATALGWMTDQPRGLGDPAAGAMLPGMSTNYVEFELRCDEPGCPLNPFHAQVFDADYPPSCPLHPARALREAG